MLSVLRLTKIRTAFLILVMAIGILSVLTYKLNQKINTQRQVIAAINNTFATRSEYRPVALSDTSVSFPNAYASVPLEEETSKWLYKLSDSATTGYDLAITNQEAFAKPQELSSHPNCVPMVELREHKRDPHPNEDGPITDVSTANPYRPALYMYTPKLGVCSSVYSDSELLQTQTFALSITTRY